MSERTNIEPILVAEDHELTRRMLVRCLSTVSSRVLEAATLDETFALLERERPALITLDLSLGEGPKGISLCRAVRNAAARTAAVPRGPRIIVNTSHEYSVDAKIELLRSGADTYFQKGEPVSELIHAARMLLSPEPARSEDAGRSAVLLIDDDEEFLKGISISFRSHGLCPKTARSAPVAILHALERRPDAILLDIGMPRMDGREALRILRSLPGMRDVPILMLTAKDDDELRELCLRDGADGYIVKDGRDWGDVVEKVCTLLPRRP